MADYSKQWCDINDSEMPYDFDILEEFGKLPKNNYIPIICEGFGFCVIAKDAYGKCMLGFENNDEDIDWIHYDEYLEDYQIKNRIDEK